MPVLGFVTVFMTMRLLGSMIMATFIPMSSSTLIALPVMLIDSLPSLKSLKIVHSSTIYIADGSTAAPFVLHVRGVEELQLRPQSVLAFRKPFLENFQICFKAIKVLRRF